ncbi:hypothetical protein BD779DRAFT_159037 [Infundibulicybe gibba]|nr:hypothetical protein BD779DRAFT_159037 [Infundibulicybe gibba]
MSSLCTRSPPPHGVCARTDTPSHPKPTRHPCGSWSLSATPCRSRVPIASRHSGRMTVSSSGGGRTTPGIHKPATPRHWETTSTQQPDSFF